MNSSASVKGCSRHTRQLVIQAEVVLERHRGERDVLWLDINAFFGLNRLVQTITQTAARHHPARKFVNQDNFAVADDIVFVFLKQLVRAQTLVDVVHNRGAFRIVEGESPLPAARGRATALRGTQYRHR